MVDTSSCFTWTCGEIVSGHVDTCPKCGGRMRSSRTVQRLGWLLLLAGVAIAGMMSMIILSLLPAFVSIQGIQNTTRFNGTPEQARQIMSLLFIVLAFGIAGILNGLIQIVSGRRSRAALLLSFGLAALAAISAYATVTSL